jgi:hypothetical protein
LPRSYGSQEAASPQSLAPNPLLPTRRELALGRCVGGRQQLPAARFSQASADTDPMPVASHRASGRLHAVLRQSRNAPALSRQHGILTIDRGEVYRLSSQAGPGNDINAGSTGFSEGANVEPRQPGCHPGASVSQGRFARSLWLRFHTAQAVARARWRMLRPQLGLAFIGPDRLARFGGPFSPGAPIGCYRPISIGHPHRRWPPPWCRITMPTTGNAFRSPSRSALRISSDRASPSSPVRPDATGSVSPNTVTAQW